MAAPAGDFAQAPQAQSRQPPARHHRRGRPLPDSNPGTAKGRSKGRCAADRRHRLRAKPPAAAGGRNRHGEDRACRRLRPLRHRGRATEPRASGAGPALVFAGIARRSALSCRAKALNRDRDLHHCDRDRRGKDLRRRLAHPALAADRPSGRRHHADRDRIRPGTGGGERSQHASRRARPAFLAGIDRSHFTLALSRRLVARPGGTARGPQHRRR